MIRPSLPRSPFPSAGERGCTAGGYSRADTSLWRVLYDPRELESGVCCLHTVDRGGLGSFRRGARVVLRNESAKSVDFFRLLVARSVHHRECETAASGRRLIPAEWSIGAQ